MWRTIGLLFLAACAGGGDDEGPRDGGGGLDAGARDAGGGGLVAGARDTGVDAPGADAPPSTDAGTDAPVAPDAGTDAGPVFADGGCRPGTSRECTIMCEGGATAM